MFPSLKKGDYVFCANKNPKDIKVGDIVAINSEFFFKNKRDLVFFERHGPHPLIHRVVHKEERNGVFYFITKGDNNQRLDGATITLRKRKKYILLEYNPSKLILIPEDEIIGVILNKSNTNSEIENLVFSYIDNFIPYSQFEKVHVKLFVKKEKKN